MTRRYDEALVHRMRERQEHVVEQGLEVLVKPVPDAHGRDVFDPKVVEFLAASREAAGTRSDGAFRLSRERSHSMDRTTPDLTQRPVTCDEFLVPVGDDHMIDVYAYRPALQRPASSLLVYVHGGGFTAGDAARSARFRGLRIQRAARAVPADNDHYR